MQFHKEQPAMGTGDFVISTLLTATLAVSVLAGILEALEVTVPYTGMILTGCAGAALMQLLFSAEGKVQTIGVMTMLGIPWVGALLCRRTVSTGAAVICNRILEFAGAATGTYYLPFSTAEGVSETAGLLLLVIFLMMWLTCGLSYLQRESHPFISTCILLMILIVNGCIPDAVSGGWALITGLCIGLLFVWHQLGDKGLYLKAVVFILCMAGVLWMGTAAADGPLKAGKSQLTASVHQTISSKIAESRYGSSENRSMPMGDFENLRDLQFSDAEMLKIKGKTYESLYLRGFAAGNFDGMKWTTVEGDVLYGKGSTFYWLHDSGYFGQNLLAKSTSILDPAAEKKTLEYEIENLGADGRVYYTPYELMELENGGETVLTNQMLAEDTFPAAGWKGWTQYEVKTLENQVKRYPELILTLIENLKSEKLTDFRKAESHYNRFVYENYTSLSEDEQQLMEKYLGEADFGAGSHMEYEAAKEAILRCLDDNVVYGEKLLEPSRKNFVKDFLEVNKSGYSVHYATTAALMFRYYGIPARYVEGYLITPDAAKDATGSEALVLTDKDAHAWTEYYQDGIGWLPFEATPPYRDVMEQPEQLQSADSQTVSENTSTSLGMEMIEDNYEPEEPEKEEETKQLPWGKIALGGLALILLVLTVLLAVHLWRRRKKLAARKASFLQEDRNLATATIFRYCMELHGALGIAQRNCSVYDYGTEIGQIAGTDTAETYLCIAEIYQKAVYSRTGVTCEEWEQVLEYKENLLHTLQTACSLPKRAGLKWVKGLY